MHEYICARSRASQDQAPIPSRSRGTSSGFTIVELLVVIVVIGILAAITIVAYTGISQKAVASALQSDLANASTRLKMFQVDNSAYPTANNCPTPGATEICLKFSPGNTFVGYSASNQSNSQTFLLIANNGNIAYRVTNNSAPTQLASTMQPGVTPGAALELHAAKANLGTGPGINGPLTTTWKDTSGNGNNGTLNGFSGTPWAGAGTPSDPYALDFSGDGDVVNVPHSSSTALGTDFTVEFWTKDLTAYSNGYVWLATKGDDDDWLARGLLVLIADSQFAVSLGEWFSYAGGGPVSDITALHHLLLTRTAGQGRTYVDMVPRGEAENSYDCSGLIGEWNIGAGASPGPGGLNGQSIIFRQYPFALTPEQVSANYAAGPDW